MTLAETTKANRDRYNAARELQLRAIIAKANTLIAKPRSAVAELEFMQALRAEFGDGQGFEAAWESACMDAGWDEDAGDYTCNVKAGERFDRSRRTDLAIAMGAR